MRDGSGVPLTGRRLTWATIAPTVATLIDRRQVVAVATGAVTGAVRIEVNGAATSVPISGLPTGTHTISLAFLGNGTQAPSGTTVVFVVVVVVVP